MAVPKSRHTKSKRNRRRANIFIEAKTLSHCSNCGNPKLPHLVCPACGYYRGKERVAVLAGLDRKKRKRREKEIKTKGQEQTEKTQPLDLKKLSRK